MRIGTLNVEHPVGPARMPNGLPDCAKSMPIFGRYMPVPCDRFGIVDVGRTTTQSKGPALVDSGAC